MSCPIILKVQEKPVRLRIQENPVIMKVSGQGLPGATPMISVGTVRTVPYTQPAAVRNTGSGTRVFLDFDIPAGVPGGIQNWGEIGGTLADQDDLQEALDGKAASSHNHAAEDIISGTLAVARGGTGAGTASAARTNLGISGSIINKTGSQSISNNNRTQVLSQSYAAGTWIHVMAVLFPNNQTGRRSAYLSATGTGDPLGDTVQCNVAPVNGAATVAIGVYIETLSAATTRYVSAYQNSGDAMTVDATLRSIKLW